MGNVGTIRVPLTICTGMAAGQVEVVEEHQHIVIGVCPGVAVRRSRTATRA